MVGQSYSPGLLLTTITFYSFELYADSSLSFPPSAEVLAAILVIMAAIIFRSLRQLSPLGNLCLGLEFGVIDSSRFKFCRSHYD